MIIGICGRAGAGKSTLVAELALRYPSNVILPMAAPIKAMAQVLGLSPMQLFGNLKEVPDLRFSGKTPRYIMQTLGTEWGRKTICNDIWVNAWENAAKQTLDDVHVILCDDVRFPNEIQKIRDIGGIILAVERPDQIEKKKPWWKRLFNRQHLSEQLDFEAYGIPVLLNNGTPHDLLKKAVCYLH